MTIDVDSTVCPVVGKTKAGVAYGYAKQLGYHPLVAVRAEPHQEWMPPSAGRRCTSDPRPADRGAHWA